VTERGRRPAGDHARLQHLPVVHPALALLPRRVPEQLVEDLGVVGRPAPDLVDPGPRVQLVVHEPAEVQRRAVLGVEERALPRQRHSSMVRPRIRTPVRARGSGRRCTLRIRTRRPAGYGQSQRPTRCRGNRGDTMLVAFSVSPVGTGEAVGAAVAEAVRVVRESGLPNRTDAMFTTIEGEWDEVMAVVKAAADAVAASAPRVSLVLKADIRPGFTDMLTAKIASVERHLEV